MRSALTSLAEAVGATAIAGAITSLLGGPVLDVLALVGGLLLIAVGWRESL